MRELISKKQIIALIVAFILDGSIILPTAPEGGRDLWLSIIIAIFISCGLFWVYSEIQMLYVDKDLFDICNLTLGKFIGSILNILYIWYFLHLASLTLRDFGEFMNVLTMPETPKFVIMLVPCFISAYAVKKGIEVIGRFSLFSSVFTLTIIVILAILLTTKIDIKNILPVMGDGISPVMEGAWSAATFPFGECVIFLCITKNINDSKLIKKSYFAGLAIGGLFILFTSLYEILILGEEMYGSLYFPAYRALSRIRIGDFIQRLEIIGGLVLNVFGLIKISICIYACSIGISKILKVEDYTAIVIPVVLVMFNLSNILYENLMELVSWTSQIYKYYALPFQLFFPIMIFIAAKIKNTKNN